MTNGEADWAHLPKLLAYLIMDKLLEAVDRIRFGFVCSNWSLLAKEYKEDRSLLKDHKKVLPMLMIPATNHHKKRRLYGVAEGKIYPIHLSVPNKLCAGSSHGWLAFVYRQVEIRLLNPFKNGITIGLPPLEVDWFDRCPINIQKVILSIDPLKSPNDYVVVVIYAMNSRLAFLKSCQNKWEEIDPSLNAFSDVIFYKNVVYAVDHFCGIVTFNPDGIGSLKRIARRDGSLSAHRAYLVESSNGDLLLVQRRVECGNEDRPNTTISIKVYKLVFDPRDGVLIERVEMASLDGDALFVGINYSHCVGALDFPMCKPNSVYFTNHFTYELFWAFKGPCDLGLYSLDEKRFGEHYKFKASDMLFHPAFWVLPPV